MGVRQKDPVPFLFLLLGSSSLNGWDLLIYFANNAFGKAYNPVMAYRFLVKPFAWLDHHLFHVGYDPAHHESWPGDTHFGVVFYLTLLLLSVIGTVIWTALDRNGAGMTGCGTGSGFICGICWP